MYKKELKPFIKKLRKLYEYFLFKSFPVYQPVIVNGKYSGDGDRNCIDRWNLISKEIRDSNITNVLDIGSAEGYYVLRVAKEHDCVSVGVEADVRRLSVAQSQLIAEKISSAGFIYKALKLESIKTLPKFDMVIFMSVMHHIMYSEGEEYARKFLKEIREITKKILIFDMGQSNEIENKWAKLLPDMGDNPEQWIRDFILSCGFSKVTKIGETDSYKKDQSRTIFKVEP